MEGIIRFSYARIIDTNTTFAWDKSVFENSFFEYRIQVQNFAGFDKSKSFAQFLQEVPDSAKIHHRVTPAILQHLKQLQGIIPQITDVNGALCLEFSQFKFEILEADFNDKSKFRIRIEFVTEPFLCVGMAGDNFVVSALGNLEKFRNTEEIPTKLLPLQKALNVYSFRKII